MFRKINLLVFLIIFLLAGVSQSFSATGYICNLLAGSIYEQSMGILAGGKVYTYGAGTTTPKGMYTDVNMTTTADNPIILDNDGRAIVFGDGVYKFIIKDKYDQSIITIDNYELTSITDFITQTSDPFGATLNQTTLNASAVISLTVQAEDITVSDDLIVADDITCNGDYTGNIKATMTFDLDANNYNIINLDNATETNSAVSNARLEGRLSGISSLSIAVYRTYGLATWTCPTGVTKAYVTIIGAGGGGGGWGDAGNFAGEAGDCGQAMVKLEATVIPGNDYEIEVGFSGSQGMDGSAGMPGTNGSNGGDSRFEAWTAKGGIGGRAASAGQDCAAGVGIALSKPANSWAGNVYNGGITGNSSVRGQGGRGGYIASYTLGAISNTATGGTNGMVVIEW